MGRPNQHSEKHINPFICYITTSTTTSSTTTTEEPDIILYPSGNSCIGQITTPIPIFDPICCSGIVYPAGMYKVSDIIIPDDGCGPYKLTLRGNNKHLFKIVGKSLYYLGGSYILCTTTTTTTSTSTTTSTTTTTTITP